jgi:hypothetical protein
MISWSFSWHTQLLIVCFNFDKTPPMNEFRGPSKQMSFTLLALLLWATGCGNQAHDTISSHHAITGSLESKLSKILENQWAEACDRVWGDKALEVARALDTRENEIKKVLESIPTSEDYRQVPLPPTYAREAIVKFKSTPGWNEYSESWSNIYQEYLKIKDQPTQYKWVNLNTSVRSILADDTNRIGGTNVYLDRISAPLLEKALREIQQCTEKPSCIAAALSPDSEAFVKRIPYYDFYWQKIGKNTDAAHDRANLEKLASDMKADLEGIGFVINPNVSLKNDTLALSLDPGPFSPSQDFLAKTIETIWSSKNLKLKIQWASAQSSPQIFKLLLGDTPGERSNISREEKTVQLFPNVRLKSIAHEIGHVLGFRDHYYTVWHPEKCSYVVQNNDEDLMSNPETGRVTPEEWNELKIHYSQAASQP